MTPSTCSLNPVSGHSSCPCSGWGIKLTDNASSRGKPLRNECFVQAQMQDIEAVAGGDQSFIWCADQHKHKALRSE